MGGYKYVICMINVYALQLSKISHYFVRFVAVLLVCQLIKLLIKALPRRKSAQLLYLMFISVLVG